MGCSLVGNHIRNYAPFHQFGIYVRRICPETYGERLSLCQCLILHLKSLVKAVGPCVQILPIYSPVYGPSVHFHDYRHTVVHGNRKGLGTPHLPEAGTQDPFAGKVVLAELLLRKGAQCFIGSLKNALRSYVNPGACGHLAVHYQAPFLQFPEIIPVRPLGHEHGIHYQNSGGIRMGFEDGHRFSRLDKKGIVNIHLFQRLNYGIVRLPVPCGLPRTPVDDEIRGILGHLRVQIVHQHSHGGLCEPAPACKFFSSGCFDCPQTITGKRIMR